ncbi:hypothetical protein HORIV_39060 [Vreelandella olivaria]|uniref:Omega-protein n=1 Tax=Vreelandella olivaria TaxID=390919 RepID=A0ABM8HNN8_9GAMM|nr:hypothetical protein HORIV_39060 [Halomonas olivaria]
MDREGEAIAWHLRETIGGDDNRYKRVVFNEITKNAIQDAFKAPGALNIPRVEAQQARRFLDRVVGFMLAAIVGEGGAWAVGGSCAVSCGTTDCRA